MLTFLIGGGSLFTLAENITVATQDFDLGNGIIGKWDKNTQTLAMTGQGKIIKEKWNGIVGTLRLTQVGTEDVKIHF